MSIPGLKHGIEVCVRLVAPGKSEGRGAGPLLPRRGVRKDDSKEEQAEKKAPHETSHLSRESTGDRSLLRRR